MLHRLAAPALGLALLVPTQSVAAPPASDPGQRASSTTTRLVELGHRPVRANGSSTVRLVFTGRRGQLVNLARWSFGGTEPCGARSLKVRGGVRVQRWAPGYWRLPKRATYVVTHKACDTTAATSRLQLRRVVQHDAAVPGVRTTIGARRNVTHLVPVRVGTSQRVGVEPDAAATVIGPDRRTSEVGTDGAVLRSVGRHWVELGPGGYVDTNLTVERAAAVDGDAIELPRTGTASTTQEITFTGSADQWVYVELLDAAGNEAADTGRDVRVNGPDGRQVDKVVLHRCPARRVATHCTTNGPWLLPSAGTYRMTLVPDSPAAEASITLRLRAALVAPQLSVDGPAVTYTATTPGQWVVGRYPVTPAVPASSSRHTEVWAHTSNASASLGAWTYTMAPRFPWSLSCTERDGNGCDDYSRVQLGPGSPSIETLPDGGPAADSWAVLVVPPGGTGSVDVALTRSVAQP